MREGETVAVLTRGAERGEYADAFLWAIQKLGAAGYPMRLPAPAGADATSELLERVGSPAQGRAHGSSAAPEVTVSA